LARGPQGAGRVLEDLKKGAFLDIIDRKRRFNRDYGLFLTVLTKSDLSASQGKTPPFLHLRV